MRLGVRLGHLRPKLKFACIELRTASQTCRAHQSTINFRVLKLRRPRSTALDTHSVEWRFKPTGQSFALRVLPNFRYTAPTHLITTKSHLSNSNQLGMKSLHSLLGAGFTGRWSVIMRCWICRRRRSIFLLATKPAAYKKCERNPFTEPLQVRGSLCDARARCCQQSVASASPRGPPSLLSKSEIRERESVSFPQS